MIKVLIADDERKLVDYLEFSLGKTGKYAVVKAHTNTAAVEIAKDNPDIRVVILDTDCLGGGAVAEALRNLCPGCKIVLNSGGVTGDEDPAQLGVDMVLPRVDPMVLMIRISELVDQEVVEK